MHMRKFFIIQRDFSGYGGIFQRRIQDLCSVQVEFRALFKVLQADLNVEKLKRLFIHNLFRMFSHVKGTHVVTYVYVCTHQN